MTETTIWVRAWQCKGCGYVWWGEYKGGKPCALDFCKKCGGQVVLGAAQADDEEHMKSDAPFKPAATTEGATSQAFICSHCGAPNTVKETP